jgi:hypothetical protein
VSALVITVLLAVGVILAGAAHFELNPRVRLAMAIGAVVCGGIVLIGSLVH